MDLSTVGPRLRDLRTRRGLTLAELSEQVGISVSTLSRLESGGRKPTLELLLPLAELYRVPLDELVDAPRTGDPRVHPRPFTRNGVTFVPLSRRPGGVQAYKLVFPSGRAVAQLQTHEGYEWAYVLAGRIQLQLGERVLVLADGEVAEFDCRLPHALTNPFPVPAEVLSLFGPQGERLHVRARPARG